MTVSRDPDQTPAPDSALAAAREDLEQRWRVIMAKQDRAASAPDIFAEFRPEVVQHLVERYAQWLAHYEVADDDTRARNDWVRGEVKAFMQAGSAQPAPAETAVPDLSFLADPPATVDVQPRTLEEVDKIYTKWLGDDDLMPFHASLAAYVANEVLQGDPVWLMLVGGSGYGKTEDVRPLGSLPHCRLVSGITGEAALLSLSPARERNRHSTGGILVELGSHGLLIIKDFTTILSMQRDARDQVLAALREIADGSWVRDAGADGGRKAEWHGKLGIVAGSTTAIDTAHAVMAKMGARFLFIRKGENDDRDELALRALDDAGREAEMRAEITEAVRGLLLHPDAAQAAHEVTREVRRGLTALANLTSVARSPVERDYRRQIVLVNDAEAPTRVVKALAQMYRAAGIIGMSEADAWELVRRLASDSIPKLRRRVTRTLIANRLRPPPPPAEPPVGAVSAQAMLAAARDGSRPPEQPWTWATTSDVAAACNHPRTTVKEALEDLMVHGLVEQWQQLDGDEGKTRPYWWRLSDTALDWVSTWLAVTASRRQ